MATSSTVPRAPGTPLASQERFHHEDDTGDELEQDSKPQCRVCWEHSETSSLLSPCLCSGTQKHVHLKCLRRWQEALQKRDTMDERAFRCSVCRAPFSVPPPKGRGGGGGGAALQTLRGLGGALCILLLACGLSGPPWPHLALLVLLIFGSRWHWLPGLALMLTGSLLAGLHARGLRVVLRVDGGGRLGLALIRHGAPVPGIGAGVLLVASEGLDHSIFRRSVVLLTQHGSGGARGVMLTQPMAHPPTLPAGLEAATGGTAAGSEAGAAATGASGGGVRGVRGSGSGHQGSKVALKHFLGGPVGMPGEGVNHEVLVVHSVPEVPGARRILPPANTTAAGGAAAAAAAGSDTAGGASLRLYEGGSLSEVLERAAESSAAAAAAAKLGRGGRGRQHVAPAAEAAATAVTVLLFHGVCAWAEGQLEGELRAGAWGFTTRAAQDVPHLLSLPPEELWHVLANSPLLARAR